MGDLLKTMLTPKMTAHRSKYVLILGHLGCRASMLASVLGQHEEILGNRPLNLSYTHRKDLLHLRSILRDAFQTDLDNKYLLDVLQQNDCMVSKKMLKFMKPKVIFILRDPVPSIKSVAQFARETELEFLQDPVKVTENYCTRLLYLEEYAKLLKRDFFFLDSDHLDDPSTTLYESLSQWLALEKPLERGEGTDDACGDEGEFDDGVPSADMVDTMPQDSYSHIQIPEDCLSKAIEAHKLCMQVLNTGMNAEALASNTQGRSPKNPPD